MCIKEAKQLLDLGYEHQALSSMLLGMEWIGAFLDGKPSGAKNQSRKRFEITLGKLPAEYAIIHQEIDLYRQLRNRSIHNPWMPSKFMEFTDRTEDHLSIQHGTIQFSVLAFSLHLGILFDQLNQA